MFFTAQCQAEAMGRRFFGDEEVEPCKRQASAVREGFHLCWLCTEALDCIRAFAARVVAGTVDGTSEPERGDDAR